MPEAGRSAPLRMGLSACLSACIHLTCLSLSLSLSLSLRVCVCVCVCLGQLYPPEHLARVKIQLLEKTDMMDYLEEVAAEQGIEKKSGSYGCGRTTHSATHPPTHRRAVLCSRVHLCELCRVRVCVCRVGCASR